ncbi:MAG: ParA family protein, partial [Pseudomonadota bacterium]
MRTILVLNAKGGSGKSTIATNLASYYAWEEEKSVVLADFDPQASSIEWLKARGEEWPEIRGVEAWEGTPHIPRNADALILDAPSRVY